MTCVEGCTCEPFKLDGHTPDQHSSQTQLTAGGVAQSAKCRMQVEVLPETQSGEHKVKVIGAIVSDVASWQLSNGGTLRTDFGGGSQVEVGEMGL